MKFVDHEVELLEKKNSADKKPTAQQLANASTKDSILEVMEDGKSYTITDLIKVVPACADMTNQRVSALVRQLVADGSVIRIEDKRKAYFKKA
jgi:predicted transcriptional regulator